MTQIEEDPEDPCLPMFLPHIPADLSPEEKRRAKYRADNERAHYEKHRENLEDAGRNQLLHH